MRGARPMTAAAEADALVAAEEETVADDDEDYEEGGEEEADEAAGIRVPGNQKKVATTIYRITSGFASHHNNNSKRLEFVSHHETQTAAFMEVRRLCGLTAELSKHEKGNFYRAMWGRYHSRNSKNEPTHNYISPYLKKENLVGPDHTERKPGVINGQIVRSMEAPIATQFAVVMADHDDKGAVVRFPWGQFGWVKPE